MDRDRRGAHLEECSAQNLLGVGDPFAHLEWVQAFNCEWESAWSDEDNAYLARWVAPGWRGPMADADSRLGAFRALCSATNDVLDALLS